jgi:type IV pilus assembly protein PilM
MGLFSSTSDFFGLDIGTTAIRAVQIKGGKTKTLAHYGSLPIDSKIAKSDANADQQKLGQAIKQLVAQTGISTPNVAVGLPSNKTFLTVVDIDRLSPQELDKTIRLQADSLIPTPLDESKIDWAILGDSPKETSKVEILLGSINNSFVEKRLDMLESLGLNVIAFEPESLAITRALLEPGVADAQLLLDMGNEATDLVITLNDAPRLIRSIPTGTDTLIKSAMQNLGIDQKQAQQFVYKFGLSEDKLEGQIYHAIIGAIDVLVGEIEKSVKFFATRYQNVSIGKIIVTGGISTLPQFPLYLANKLAIPVEIGNAWRNVVFPATQQNDLLKVSYQFSVASGLAERME